ASCGPSRRPGRRARRAAPFPPFCATAGARSPPDSARRLAAAAREPLRSSPVIGQRGRAKLRGISMTTEQGNGAMLDARLEGRVVQPDGGDWDLARQAFNLSVDQRPELVAFPADATDVARVVRAAKQGGLRIAAQRTG